MTYSSNGISTKMQLFSQKIYSSTFLNCFKTIHICHQQFGPSGDPHKECDKAPQNESKVAPQNDSKVASQMTPNGISMTPESKKA